MDHNPRLVHDVVSSIQSVIMSARQARYVRHANGFRTVLLPRERMHTIADIGKPGVTFDLKSNLHPSVDTVFLDDHEGRHFYYNIKEDKRTERYTSGTTLLKSLFPEKGNIAQKVHKSCYHNTSSEYFNMSVKEVEKHFEFLRDKGTFHHFELESLMLGNPLDEPSEEYQIAIAAMQDHPILKGLVPLFAEKVFKGSGIGVAGSADLVLLVPPGHPHLEPGTIVIADYKFNQNVDGCSLDRNGMPIQPFDDTPTGHIAATRDLYDTKGTKFFLQLQLYAFMARKSEQLKVSYLCNIVICAKGVNLSMRGGKAQCGQAYILGWELDDDRIYRILEHRIRHQLESKGQYDPYHQYGHIPPTMAFLDEHNIDRSEVNTFLRK